MSSSTKGLDTTDVIISTDTKLLNGIKEDKKQRGPSPARSIDGAAADNELEDKLTELDKSALEDSETKRKSATLTPSSGTDVSASGMGGRGPTGSNSFSSITRNNLRRSFTLPRSLLARKSGQTGPVSENQNGSFMKNIFLTLVRTKSVRKTKIDGKDDGNNAGSSEGELGKPNNGLSKIIELHFRKFGFVLNAKCYLTFCRFASWVYSGGCGFEESRKHLLYERHCSVSVTYRYSGQVSGDRRLQNRYKKEALDKEWKGMRSLYFT